MNRREFIRLLGFLPLSGATTLWSTVVSFGRSRLDKHTAQTVTAVTELMFPGDELPGANELGIATRILAMPGLQPLMKQGAASLDAQAKHRGAADFLALDETGKVAAVEAAFASKDSVARKFVETLRNYACQLYYTEPVIKAAFPYTGPPQPLGFTNFQDPP